MSPGTMRSAAGVIGTGTLGRTDGVIGPVPRNERTRNVELGGRLVALAAVSWGDVSTAYHSTGIPDVRVYTELPRGAARTGRIAARLGRVPVLRGALPWVVRRVAGLASDPSAETMANTEAHLWARASTADGRSVTKRMRTPNTYALTADSVVRVAQRLAAGDVVHGALTPSQALGAAFALTLDGVTLD